MILRIEKDMHVAQAGFTLLEMIVVLVIAGLLMGVALERGPLRSDAANFSAARSRVLATFRDAQTLSETSGDAVSVEVDAAHSQIATIQGKNFRLQKLPSGMHLSLSLPNGRLSPRALYVFTADGSVSGPPMILTLGKHRCILTFSPVTGRISVNNV